MLIEGRTLPVLRPASASLHLREGDVRRTRVAGGVAEVLLVLGNQAGVSVVDGQLGLALDLHTLVEGNRSVLGFLQLVSYSLSERLFLHSNGSTCKAPSEHLLACSSHHRPT